MADINHANHPGPIGIEEQVVKQHIDIKQPATIQVSTVAASPSLTPALTPDDDDIEAMAGKKIFSLERPDDKARELAKKLTLEEQVRNLSFFDVWGAWLGPRVRSGQQTARAEQRI
jgi:beta-glucosidase